MIARRLRVAEATVEIYVIDSIALGQGNETLYGRMLGELDINQEKFKGESYQKPYNSQRNPGSHLLEVQSDTSSHCRSHKCISAVDRENFMDYTRHVFLCLFLLDICQFFH